MQSSKIGELWESDMRVINLIKAHTQHSFVFNIAIVSLDLILRLHTRFWYSNNKFFPSCCLESSFIYLTWRLCFDKKKETRECISRMVLSSNLPLWCRLFIRVHLGVGRPGKRWCSSWWGRWCQSWPRTSGKASAAALGSSAAAFSTQVWPQLRISSCCHCVLECQDGTNN